MSTKVCVLVSVGRHPRSGRPRRAALDAQALELGLRLADCELDVVHVGNSKVALREYLGMGLTKLTVLPVPDEADVAPTLATYLQTSKPDVVLTGKQAETGEDSGFLPYFLAEALGYALICDVSKLALSEQVVDVQQALPHGQRRAVRCSTPVILTVGRGAPAARPCAFARMRDGALVPTDCEFHLDRAASGWSHSEAKPRPKRIVASKSTDALERLNSIVSGPARRNRVLTGLDAANSAKAIHEDLIQHNAITSTRRSE